MKRLKTASRFSIFALAFIAFLILLRILLPIGIKYGINWALEKKVPGYYGYIEDFDLVLIAGRYEIEGLHLEKTDIPDLPPLLKIGRIQVDLSWKALFKGRLLTDIVIQNAQVQFLDSKEQSKDQLGTEKPFDWRELYWTLVPFELSQLKVQDSTVRFANLDAGLESEISLEQIEAVVRNIQNLNRDQARLPTPLFISAKLFGKTPMKLEGTTNFIREPAEVDLDFEMEEFHLTELNPLLLSYGPVSFDEGKLSLYTEVATREQKIKGYVKPFVDDLKVLGNRDEFISLPHFGIELLTAFSNVLFRDHKKTIATKVEFEGSFDDPNIKTGKAIWGALGNAYTGDKIERKIEDSISAKF